MRCWGRGSGAPMQVHAALHALSYQRSTAAAVRGRGNTSDGHRASRNIRTCYTAGGMDSPPCETRCVRQQDDDPRVRRPRARARRGGSADAASVGPSFGNPENDMDSRAMHPAVTFPHPSLHPHAPPARGEPGSGPPPLHSRVSRSRIGSDPIQQHARPP
ncbi:hypothetical protein B0H12DRAFT_1070051 [Mycena haematopus]|nr:hypothetical protein B0H12DRAFT_1070051 [Mycena haematopus]